MGFYVERVLPRFLNVMMKMEPLSEQRRKCLAGVSGTVLEVGFGSGLNLPWYPEGVQRLVAVDPSREAAKLARKRIAAAPFPVEYLPLEGERIDAADASFDSIVSTYTLCTIPDPAAALAQMRRVLKPSGKFFLVEHGRSHEPKVQRWQDRLNGMQRTLFGGCNMNRDIPRLVREAGFVFDQCEQFYVPGPKPMGFTTRAVAHAG